jgi:tetratricopeptide (TPR) repeat protein
MSLINQMLKDLEHRPTQAAASKARVFAGLNGTANNKGKRRYRTLLTLIFLTTAAYLLWPVTPKHHASTAPKTLPKISTRTVPLAFSPARIQIQSDKMLPSVFHPSSVLFSAGPPAMPLILPPPALIHDISITGNPSHTRVSIGLNTATLYRLTSDPLHNKLHLSLDNSYLTRSFADIDTNGTAIKAIHAKNGSDGTPVQITLDVTPGTEVQRLSLNDESTQLVLSLKNGNAIGFSSNEASNEEANAVEPELKKTASKATSLHYANRLYRKALALIHTHQLDNASIKLESLLSQTPNYAPARETLAGLFIEEGQLSEASRVLDGGLQQQPDYPPFVELRARVLIAEGRLQEALSSMESIAPSLAEYPDYYATMATLYQRLGQQPLAAKIYQELLQIQPDNATWWAGLGISLEAMGERNASLAAYQKANSGDGLSPQLASYISNRVEALGGES